MTREQIEQVLKTAQAKNDKEGGHTLPDGSNVTLHVSRDGASLAFQKIDGLRFDGELIYAKGDKKTVALVSSDVFAITIEGVGGGAVRRPAGFG
jgi:hypothetical protein